MPGAHLLHRAEAADALHLVEQLHGQSALSIGDASHEQA
jgi:hypothetical protein